MNAFESLHDKIVNDDWIKLRSFRTQQKSLVKDFWNVLTMILLNNNKGHSTSIANPEMFHALVIKSFNSVFIDINKTKEQVTELGHRFPRGQWDHHQNDCKKLLDRLHGKIHDSGLHLHQSILGSIHDEKMIKKVDPFIIEVIKYDRFQKKINQPISETFLQIYPRQLISEKEGREVLINNININKNLTDQYQDIALKSIRSHYGLLLLDRVNSFFTQNPDQSTFSEDKLV